jgi:hypothetical protein
VGNSNSYQASAPGTYTVWISNGGAINGYSLNSSTVTVSTVDNSVTNNSPTFTANASGATYQWFDCSNNYQIMNGETGQSFTATINGNYSVAVTQNGCTDTSACFTVSNITTTPTGVIGNTDPKHFTIYPNPSNGLSTMTVPANGEVTVFDFTGSTVINQSVTAGVSSINLNNLETGFYTVIFKSTDTTFQAIKLVKE